MQLQKLLEDEIKKRQNFEAIAAEHMQSCTCANLELKECKRSLAKECGNNEHLKKELQQFKVSATYYAMASKWKMKLCCKIIIKLCSQKECDVFACRVILLKPGSSWIL